MVSAKAQDTSYYIGNSALFGIGVNQGNYKSWPYKGNDWNLMPDQIGFIAEYQVTVGKLFKPLSKSYAGFFESGFKVGYQTGKITNGVENNSYDETYIGLPVALGLLKKNNHKIIKHTLGFAVYGSVLEEVGLPSENDSKWSFFSQARGTIFLNTQLFFPSKKKGRYRGLGLEISKDLGFGYNTTPIPFAIENMRVGITFSPFCDFF